MNRYSLILMLCVLFMVSACRRNNQQLNGDQQAAESMFYDSESAAEDGQSRRTATRGRSLELPAPLKDRPEVVLKKTAYTVSYNTSTKIPNWVAWHLTAAHTQGNARRSESMFGEDPDAPAPRVTNDDYYNRGFDRGHMCPAGDNKWDRKAMSETFLFTNICPQVHKLNEGPWNDLEIACRRWARQYGDIYIVCGPILDGTQHRTIGKNKVVVPERFFKVILCMKEKPMAIGFIYDNNGHNSEKMFSHATTVDEVERITGIDFFPALNDQTESSVEAVRGYFGKNHQRD